MPPVPKQVSLAVLDDYHNLSSSLFAPISTSFKITHFPDTLPAYNAASTAQSAKDELVQRLKPFTIISSMRERTPFPAELLKQLPNLKLLLTTGTRNLGIDMGAANKLGIVVTGAKGSGRTDKPPGKSTGKGAKGPDSTTQHTVALILAISRNISADDANVKNGLWQTALALGLSGKNFSTLGLGRLGGNVAKIMYQSFGMRILCWSENLTQENADRKAVELGLAAEDEEGKVFKAVSKEELFKEADVLSVHVVLSERSRGIVGAKDLALMKKGAVLINTSRGPVVNEDALFDILEKGGIRGAAADVFESEPLEKESEWRNKKWGTEGRGQLLVTPHMGYVEEEVMTNWYAEQVEILERWLKGEPLLNVLNA
jgi:lactate dehydrogenase-like 2-hydroxyacid dehydrogenase